MGPRNNILFAYWSINGAWEQQRTPPFNTTQWSLCNIRNVRPRRRAICFAFTSQGAQSTMWGNTSSGPGSFPSSLGGARSIISVRAGCGTSSIGPRNWRDLLKGGRRTGV
jgi:hypothetical protein